MAGLPAERLQATTTNPIVIELDSSHDPCEALRLFRDLPRPCLLHSGTPDHPVGQFSFLAADPVACASTSIDAWPQTVQHIRTTIGTATSAVPGLPPLQGGWMGWLPYELAGTFGLPGKKSADPVGVGLALYDWIVAWDHRERTTWLISTGVDSEGMRDHARAVTRAVDVQQRWTRRSGAVCATTRDDSRLSALRSDFTPFDYQRAVAKTIDYIRAGDIYQANISQRFSMLFAGDAAVLHEAVTRESPAPMAAFVAHDSTTVVSASPERFLRLDAATGRVETRPIKGTRPRSEDAAADRALALELAESEKDWAENVMIVDLMRNDLSRVCRPGSVRVTGLCEVESHAAVHHLVSTVTGTLREECDALDLLAATFPGGSISGVPKRRAMEIINEIEPVERGIYTGSVTWIGLDGSMDTSIAIRTITIRDGLLSFHVGGGVTALSDPAEEYDETLAKGAAIRSAIACTP